RSEVLNNQDDFGAIIERLRQARPNVVCAAIADNPADFLRQLRAAGLTMPVVGGDGFNTGTVLTDAGPAANGLYVASSWSMDSPDPENAGFVQRFRATFGRDPDPFAAQAYAGMQIVREAVRLGGRT